MRLPAIRDSEGKLPLRCALESGRDVARTSTKITRFCRLVSVLARTLNEVR